MQCFYNNDKKFCIQSTVTITEGYVIICVTLLAGRESHGVRDMTRKSHTASHFRVGREAHGAGLEKHLA